MAKRGNEKEKLLLILDYLRRETDEQHPASARSMVEMLARNGIEAERKSIYADLDALAAHGLDIQRIPGPKGGVYLGGREFELAELKLLVDAVQASRFISRRKSGQLIAKLEALTSRHQASQLQRQVFVGGRAKTMNESVYYAIDAIHDGISRRKMVSFLYFDYNSAQERVFRREGRRYRVAPYCLAWDNANYYLVGQEPGEEDKRHYRVDKMYQVEVEDAPAAIPADFDPAAYVNRYFSMYSGRPARVRLRCVEALARVILDRFGREAITVPDGDGFTVTLDVVVSPQFWGWLAALGPGARLIEPAWARAEYAGYLKSLLDGNDA